MFKIIKKNDYLIYMIKFTKYMNIVGPLLGQCRKYIHCVFIIFISNDKKISCGTR